MGISIKICVFFFEKRFPWHLFFENAKGIDLYLVG